MRLISKITAAISLSILAACAMGPDYDRPSVDVPISYKEDIVSWRPAKPRDELNYGSWWYIYNDPVLDELERQVEISNQNLKAAEAAYREANAIVKETRSALFPSITLNSWLEKQNEPMPTPTLPYTLYAMGSWTPDVWGRIRRSIESDKAKAQASAADLAAARLSMQIALATAYFDLRTQDELGSLFNQIAVSERKTLKIIQNKYERGTATRSDVWAARNQLENVQVQAAHTKIRRAQLEHAIAVLVGKPPADFSLSRKKFVDKIPSIPPGLPSELLERRPDIASAERMVAAANAQIGVASAAWYPDITLSASGGYAGMTLSKLLQSSNIFWAVGPSLAQTIFDGGAREARIEAARAMHDRSVAMYRQTVLTAFQQVEDNLAAIRILNEQYKVQKAVVSHSRQTEQLTLSQYTKGTVPYSNVLAAQNARLNNEQTMLMVRQSRIDASIALIHALGGGWNVSQLPRG